MWRIIPFVFAVIVLAIYFNFQSIRLNMLNWSVDTTRFHDDRIKETKIAASRDERQAMSLQDKIKDISGELAFEPDKFVRNRLVGTERFLTIEDILKPGEAAPSEEYETLYMKARAASILIRDCLPVLDQLAVSCRVHEAKVAKKRNGRFKVGGSLAYLPAYEMGTPAAPKGEIVSSSFDLTLETPTDDTFEARQVYLERAMTICAILRETFGNCFISRVKFYLRHPASDSKRTVSGYLEDLKLAASAGFSVHGLWSDVNQQSLDNLVKKLGEEY